MNSRTFFLRVDPILLPYTMDENKKSGFVNIKTREGYNLSYKKGTAPAADEVQSAVQVLDKKILIAINREVTRLMNYWRSRIKVFFNRARKEKNKSSCLRNALKIEAINSFGVRFYVTSCYKHGVDYVQGLVKGAGPTLGNHYVPKLNRRMPGGVWGGIPTSYWATWQRQFQLQINISQKRLDMEIARIVTDFKRSKYGPILYGSATTPDKNWVKKKEEMLYKKRTDNVQINDSSNYSKFFSEQKKGKTTQYTKQVPKFGGR